MKHFLLILILIVAGYALWHVSDRKERNTALKQITRHGIRLVAVLVVLICLLLLSTQFASSSII
jgi:hypothetical protein